MNLFDVFEYVFCRIYQVISYKRMVYIVLKVEYCLLEVLPILFDSYIYFIVYLESCLVFLYYPLGIIIIARLTLPTPIKFSILDKNWC